MLHLNEFYFNATCIQAFRCIFFLVFLNLFDVLYSPLLVHISIDLRNEVAIRPIHHILHGSRG